MAVNADRFDKSFPKPFNRVMLCNLICNLLHDSGANEAIKTLQDILESLIAVVKNSSLKNPFHYGSALWSNKNAYKLPVGKTGFDFEETKLPTYWYTSFSKICLGMKIPGQPIRLLVINKQAQSLHSLIADRKYRSTSLNRNTWKTLVGSQASLQANCDMEGFNATSHHCKARIGIIGNNENNCQTADSRIRFGAGGYTDNSNTCGNFALNRLSSDNGGKTLKPWLYILVQ